MIYQHKDLAAGRWGQLSFAEQMANIGSEVIRAINWRNKKNTAYSQMAFERALELIDLSLNIPQSRTRLKELTRLRETIVDDFAGENEFGSSDTAWQNYFLAFTYSARRHT